MMATTGSLLFFRELGINRSSVYNSQPKGKRYRGHPHIFAAGLSSHTSLKEAWSVHLLSARESIKPTPSRCKVLVCRSLFSPNGGNHIPILKTAAAVLTRSYEAFHGRSIVVQLIPAVGIIAFAAWGLGPLLRACRILFFQKNDNSWNKSKEYQVMTSYIQPLLLWGGAVLICRVLEPVILPSAPSQAVKQRLLNFVRSLSSVLAFAYCLSSLIQQTQKFFVEKKDPSDARSMGYEFAGKAVYSAVWVASISLFMELLGFSTQKWVTAGGLGTVLLTLAGREIFTNFLSSVMIHATRPFVLSEWIQTKIDGYEVSGTVEHVGWWSPTIIRGDDREAIHIPNHKFTVNVVRNLTQKTHWRIKTHLAISHLDVNKINNIVADMRKVLAKNPQVEQQRLHRRVFLENVDRENQALLILVSCFVKTSHFEVYLGVKEAILLDLLRVISHHRARLATPIRTVQKIYRDADIDSVPFSDIFTHNRAAANRPFLLIEPSYKVNGDEKNKSTSRPTSNPEEKDSKPVTPVSTSEPVIDPNPKSTPVVKTSNVGSTGSASSSSSAVTTPDPLTVPNLKSTPAVKTSNFGSTGSASSSSSPVKTSDPVTDPNPKSTPEVKTSNLGSTGSASSASSSSSANTKIESEKPLTQRSALEDNIVLGVALEGSKRTLPIEDDEMGPTSSPTVPESKEMASCLNGSGGPTSTNNKDQKDDKASSGATQSDQREQEKR